MWIYLLKSSACLLVFLLCYRLFLEREQMHIFKRFYLLGVLVASALIPTVVFTSYIEVAPIPMELLILEEARLLPAIANTAASADPIAWLPIALWSIYGLGVFIFGFKFFRNLFTIWSRIRKNPKYKNNLVTHVLLQKLISPHTFFNYLFLNKLKYEHQEIPEEVFWHEEVHARQKHSLDILLIEFLQVALWFNPLIYILKNAIKLNHEFLADQAVLQKGVDPSAYQKTLLNFSATPNAMPLANAINYSSIKKRFQLMKTITTKKSALVRSLILLPLVAILIYSFSEKVVLEKEHIPETATLTLPQQTADQKHIKEGASLAMMKKYQDFMARLDQKKMVIHYPEYKEIVAIYHIMTAAQRASVTKYPENPIGSLAKIQPKSPTKAQLEAWQDQTKFAIWIDGKVVKNNALKAYAPGDFSYFTSSFVHKNARSERFPQSHQNHLYTEKGFDKTYLQSGSDEYKSLLKKYNTILDTSTGSDKGLPLELGLLRAQLRWLYQNFSSQEKEKYNIPPLPEAPKEPSAPTPKQIAAYDAWSKKMQATPMNKRIIKMKDWNSMSAIYNAMSPEQKQKVNALPNVPPPPAMDTLYTYNRLFQRIQRNPINREANFTYLKSIYTAMSTSQKQQVKEPKAALLEEKIQEKATPKMMIEYNSLAKKYNANPKNNCVISFKHLKRLEYIYSRMTETQKEKSETFPRCSPPPPIPAPPKAIKAPKPPKKKTIEIEEVREAKEVEVEEVAEEIEVKEMAPEVEEIIVEEIEIQEIDADVEEIEVEVTELQEIEVKEIQEEKNTATSRPPSSLLDYSKELAAKNAQFYYQDKKISKEEGLKIISTYKNITVETYPYTTRQPEVKIYKKS